MKFFRLIPLIFLVLALAACSSETPVPGPTATKGPTGSTAYPAGGELFLPPTQTKPASYPPPEAQSPAATVMPLVTPDSTKATVSGVLLTNGKPKGNAPLYLARVIKDAAGNEITLSLDKSTAPAAKTGNDGKFVFYNVDPDLYGLIFDQGVTASVLLKPGSPDQLRVTVSSSAPVDLGSLDYPDLPGG